MNNYGDAKREIGVHYIHTLEMEDGLIRVFLSERPFVNTHELRSVNEEEYKADRVCESKRVQRDGLQVIQRVYDLLDDMSFRSSETFEVSEKAAFLAIELAIQLHEDENYGTEISLPASIDDTAIQVANFMNRAYFLRGSPSDHIRSTRRRFGLSDQVGKQLDDEATQNKLDFVFHADALGRARCMKVCRAGDDVWLLGSVELAAAEVIAFEWNGIRVHAKK